MSFFSRFLFIPLFAYFLAFLLLSLFATFTLRSYLIRSYLNQSKGVTYSLKEKGEKILKEGDPGGLLILTNTLLEIRRNFLPLIEEIALLSPEGKILVHPDPSLLNTYLNPPPASIYRPEPEENFLFLNNRLVTFIPLYKSEQEQPTIFIRLELSSRPIRKTLLFFILTLIFLFSLSAGGLFLLLYFYHHRRLSSSIYNLTKELEKALKGEKLSLDRNTFPEEFLPLFPILEKTQNHFFRLFSSLGEILRQEETLGDKIKGFLSFLHTHLPAFQTTLQEIASYGIYLQETTLLKDTERHFQTIEENSTRLYQRFSETLSQTQEGGEKIQSLLSEFFRVTQTLHSSLEGTNEGLGEETLKEVPQLVSEIRSTVLDLKNSYEILFEEWKEIFHLIKKERENWNILNEKKRKAYTHLERTNESIYRLSTLCEEIEKNLEEIRWITGKTNLLALNTAIIATQAGEEGKQISPVADEIRDVAVKVKVEVERVERNIEEIREIISNLTQRIGEAETLLKEPLEEKETEFTQLEKKMGEMEKEGEKQKDLWGEVEKKLTEKENFAKELGTFLAEGKEKTKQMLEKLNQYQKLLQEGKKTGDELVGFLTHGMEILQELSALQEEVKQRKTTLLQSWKLFIESAQKAAEMIRIIRESGEKIIFLLQEGESILKEYTLLRNQIRSLSF